MKLRNLKKFIQEKHGWWDTTKIKSSYGYSNFWHECRGFPNRDVKSVHTRMTYSSMHHAWREAP